MARGGVCDVPADAVGNSGVPDIFILGARLQHCWQCPVGLVRYVAQLVRNLGAHPKTASNYIDLLCHLLVVTRLQPWHNKLRKRLVKTPKVYVRDSGLLHALLRIQTREQLLSYKVAGASCEGHCIESLLSTVPRGITGYFYRTSADAEIDLLLLWPDGQLAAIEFKRSLKPKLERGFHNACEELQPQRKWVVYPGKEVYPLAADIQAVPLHHLCEVLRAKPGRDL